MQLLLFLLEVFVQTVRPLANTSDVQPHVVLLLRSAADGERVPLVLGNGGDVDKSVISRMEVEVERSFDDQMGHSGGQEKT